jgi:hypothetical protein
LGPCLSGVFKFTIEYEGEELIITSDIEDRKITLRNDGTPFMATFDMTNDGYRDLRMSIQVGGSPELELDWDPMIHPNGFDLINGQTLPLPCMISAEPGTDPGYYEISINFSSEEGPFIERSINVTVVEATEDVKDEDPKNTGIIIAVVIAVILTIIIIVIIGFFIVRRSSRIEEEETEKEYEGETGDHKYDDLEKELEIGLVHRSEQ